MPETHTARLWSIAVKRRYAAAHTLRSTRLSDAENAATFGKCANPSGHGHDYIIEFIVRADVLHDDVVVARGELDSLLDAYVTPRFAYRNLNESFGAEFVTSGENLAIAAWELLADHLPQGVHLTIRLEETRKNSFVYSGPLPAQRR